MGKVSFARWRHFNLRSPKTDLEGGVPDRDRISPSEDEKLASTEPPIGFIFR